MFSPFWIVMLVMLVVLLIGLPFLTPYRRPIGKEPNRFVVNPPPKFKGMEVKFTLASEYHRYRNPMRDLRRFVGWPSGRQWVLLRKFWNRETPNGAMKFAMWLRRTAPTSVPSGKTRGA